MSASSVGWIDVSKFSPAQLEMFGRIAYEKTHETALLPYMFATWLDVFFLGVLMVLFCVWLKGAGKEMLAIRVLAWWLIGTSLACTIAVHGQVMSIFAVRFGEYKSFLMRDWFRFFCFLSAMLKVPAASYFLWRAYILIGRKKWILFAVIPQLATIFASSTALVWVFTIPYKDSIRALIASVSALEVTSDLLVTGTIVVSLYKSQTGFANTDRLITRLLYLIVETATPPTISVLLCLFIFVFKPNSPAQMTLMYHSKVNAICVQLSLLGKNRIAEAYRASPVILGTSESKYSDQSSGSASSGAYRAQDEKTGMGLGSTGTVMSAESGEAVPVLTLGSMGAVRLSMPSMPYAARDLEKQ